MSSLIMALIALGSLCCGTILGSLMRTRLPEQHLRDDSRDVIKTASGMIATLVALVIGLLVNSSKSTYDQASANVTQIGAKVILLNRTMERYGSETKPIRDRLREGIATSVDQLWPTDGKNPSLTGIEQATSLDDVHDMIVQLSLQDEKHRSLRSQALSTWVDLVQARWLVIEQAQNVLPTAFFAMLIFWLTVLFVSLGLLAPRNATIWCCLFICAMSMSGAIYLILEMNRPLEGAIQISPAPLHKALSVIGRGTRPG
ncbi:bestrophin-like domain [Singulisphaera rosea]